MCWDIGRFCVKTFRVRIRFRGSKVFLRKSRLEFGRMVFVYDRLFTGMVLVG